MAQPPGDGVLGATAAVAFAHGPAGTPAARRPPRAPAWVDMLRWALLVCWLFVLAFAVFDGARPGSLGQLESALAAGQTQTVTISPGIPAGATGSTTQDLTWRQGAFRYHATVQMITADADVQTSQSGDIPVVTGSDVAAELLRIDPQVRIVRAPALHSGMDVYGWQVPPWLGWVALAAVVGTLSLLVSGPGPWRATRWAWFWLMTNPLGTILFLVLSGPTPLLPPPRHPARRLTGGWAFLLCLVLGWFLPHWWPPRP